MSTIGVGTTPISTAFDGANGDVYVTNLDSQTVSVIDAATEQVVASVVVPSHPWGIAYDSSTGNLYVSESWESGAQGDVVVIDGATDRIVGDIPVGLGPEAVAFDPANGYLYVTNLDSDNLTAIDGSTNKVVTSIPVGVGPQAVAYDNANGKVYVVNFDSNNVTVIDGSTDRVVGMLSAVIAPTAIAVDAADGYVCVTNFNEGDVSFFDGATDLPVGTVNVGDYPNGVVYDRANALTYVAVEGPSSLPPTNRSSVVTIDGATGQVTSSVTVGDYPAGMAVDSSNGSVFVADMYADEVSVVPAGMVTYYPVTFHEVGLPSGEPWSVTLAGVTNRSSTSSIGFREPTATGLGYTVGTEPASIPASPNGTVDIASSPVSLEITFRTAYWIWFNETGLPDGTPWNLTLNGTQYASTTTGIIAEERNGSYPFHLGAVPGYRASPPSGSVVVSGSAQRIAIGFQPQLYEVSFVRTGSLVPPNWTVTLAGVANSSTASTIGFEERNGSNYAFRVSWTATGCVGLQPSSGTLNVSGAPLTESIKVVYPSCGAPPCPGCSSTSPTFLGLPAMEGYAVLGGLIAAIVVVAAVATILSRRRKSPPELAKSPLQPSAGGPPASP